MLFKVEHWTLDGTEDVDLTTEEDGERFLAKLSHGTLMLSVPCTAGHVHVMACQCPHDEALLHTLAASMLPIFRWKATPFDGMEYLDFEPTFPIR